MPPSVTLTLPDLLLLPLLSNENNEKFIVKDDTGKVTPFGRSAIRLTHKIWPSLRHADLAIMYNTYSSSVEKILNNNYNNHKDNLEQDRQRVPKALDGRVLLFKSLHEKQTRRKSTPTDAPPSSRTRSKSILTDGSSVSVEMRNKGKAKAKVAMKKEKAHVKSEADDNVAGPSHKRKRESVSSEPPSQPQHKKARMSSRARSESPSEDAEQVMRFFNRKGGYTSQELIDGLIANGLGARELLAIKKWSATDIKAFLLKSGPKKFQQQSIKIELLAKAIVDAEETAWAILK